MTTPEELKRVLAGAECLADETQVRAAIAQLARRISEDLSGSFPLLLCVMKGGVVFSGQLLTQLQFPLEFDYVHASRYGDATEGGRLDWRVSPSTSLAGRHVLVLDDILDVGSTLDAICVACREQGAASVHTAVLVDKQHGRKARSGLRADYTGLEIPDRFVFGYGMDYRGYWRNAPGVYAVNDALLKPAPP